MCNTLIKSISQCTGAPSCNDIDPPNLTGFTGRTRVCPRMSTRPVPPFLHSLPCNRHAHTDHALCNICSKQLHVHIMWRGGAVATKNKAVCLFVCTISSMLTNQAYSYSSEAYIQHLNPLIWQQVFVKMATTFLSQWVYRNFLEW